MTRAERALERRDEIVHAAAEEFDQAGYAGASLSSIAARLNRTKGAMSYHFSSKASLAREVVETQYRRWDVVRETIEADGYRGLDAVILLSFIVGGRFRDDVLVRAGIRMQHDAGLREVALPTPFVGWNTMVGELLAQADGSIQLPAGLDTAGAAEVMVAAFTGLQQVAHRLTRARDIDERITRFWLLILPGMGIEDAPAHVERLLAESRQY